MAQTSTRSPRSVNVHGRQTPELNQASLLQAIPVIYIIYLANIYRNPYKYKVFVIYMSFKIKGSENTALKKRNSCKIAFLQGRGHVVTSMYRFQCEKKAIL